MLLVLLAQSEVLPSAAASGDQIKSISNHSTLSYNDFTKKKRTWQLQLRILLKSDAAQGLSIKYNNLILVLTNKRIHIYILYSELFTH